MDHGIVVDWGKYFAHHLKLILLQKDRPDCLDLHVRKRLANTSVSAWEQVEGSVKMKCQLPQFCENITILYYIFSTLCVVINLAMSSQRARN